MGVDVHAAGVFHMPGGIISVSAETASTALDAYGIALFDQPGYDPAVAHTPDTAFTVLPGGSGSGVRVVGASVQSPFLWPAGPDPPLAGAFDSETGFDLFVETDCDSAGDCVSSGGSYGHLVIYDPSCPNSPWLNAVTNTCRN